MTKHIKGVRKHLHTLTGGTCKVMWQVTWILCSAEGIEDLKSMSFSGGFSRTLGVGKRQDGARGSVRVKGLL